ncbi:hypothetical protein TI39_contig4173g00032 [Zymoseptoria brevis]|uniref:Uncharacterized protein n=1 Tax=Zymoseptoria brevis TaxID=1047168 RepID=A0A0F4GB35_9PEZI|nr:hypothetical protein TI39_contig4173g00032 [Zymoseptoria brevis]
MALLGGTLIHEYSHVAFIGQSALAGAFIGDYAYGPWNVRQLSRGQKLKNADNYRWFAIEQCWSVLCNREYQAPDQPRTGLPQQPPPEGGCDIM